MKTAQAVYDYLRARPNPAGFPKHAVLPDYGGYSIDRVPSLVSAALGIPQPDSPLLDLVSPPRADRVLLVILDGAGYHRWNDLARQDADVRALSSAGLLVPMTTVCPSTTVAALTTYSTGLAPSQHGMLGYRLYLREISAIVNMIQLTVVGGRGEAPLPPSLNLDSLLVPRTMYEQLEADDVDTYTLLPRGIADSGLSRVLYRGATHIHPAVGLSDMLALSREILNRATRKTVVTLYWPGLDSIAHPRGPLSSSYAAEAASVAAALRRELVGQVDHALLIVSSDHGFVSMRPSDYVPTSSVPALRDALFLFPSGEPRASYLFLRPEKRDEVRRQAPASLEGDLLLLDSREALASGLFGRGGEHPEALARLGDVLAMSTGDRGFLHPYPDSPLLAGMHGGLTADEMIVPLLVATL